MSFPVFTDAHAPKKRLVCGHGYGLPGLSGVSGLISVGGAYQLAKLQDLIIQVPFEPSGDCLAGSTYWNQAAPVPLQTCIHL